MKDILISNIDFSEEEYNSKVKKGENSFDEFIENILLIVRENGSNMDDAIFIANDSFSKIN